MQKKKKLIILITLCILLVGFYTNCQRESMNLKIISYNIRHGKGLDNIQDLSRAAEIILLQAPDLCGLQEVDEFCMRSDSVSQTNYLAKRTLMKGTFSKFMDYDKGEYGMSTLYSKPVISTKILKLPNAIYEPRSSIINEIKIAESNSILFVNVHLDWVIGEKGDLSRLKQAEKLVEFINESDLACIIVGDFNCTPKSSTMQYFADKGFVFVDKGEDKLSYQGENSLEIDHLLFRNSEKVQFKKKNLLLIKEPVVSDHRPLIAEFEVVF